MNRSLSRYLSVTLGVLAVSSATLANEAGWRTGLDLTVESASGLRGGADRGSTLHSMALGHVEWSQAENSDRAVNVHTYLSVMNLDGRGPTEKFLGDFLAASNMEGFASTRLYSWWVEAKMGDWSVRAGSLLADEEFAGTEGGGALFNSAFGWPAFVSANTVNTGPAFYVPAPGVRVERGLGENSAWRLGVYDGDAFDSTEGDPAVTRHGLHYGLGGAQGWFAISEFAFSPDKGATKLKAGTWYHTAGFADVRDDASGRRFALTGANPRQHNGNYGAYASAERVLAGKSGQAGYTTAFFRGGLAPKDRNTLGYAIDTGLATTGLIPGRSADVTALGFVHASFSPRFAASARLSDPTSPAPDFEEVVELTHSAALNDRFSVQPDLQYIRHTGGSTAQRDALALLVRVKASF